MDLYVKSQKIDQVEYTVPNWGHWCSAGYRSKGVTRYFFPEDMEAIEFLNGKNVSFNLIDISDRSFMTRLQAKITGINKTPTLILDNRIRLKGIEEIKKQF